MRAQAAGQPDETVLEADTAGGAWLEAERPAPMSPDALDQVMALIDALEPARRPFRITAAARAAGAGVQELLDLPEPLREVALNAFARRGWQFAGPGVKIAALDTGGEAEAQLLRIEPGHGAPEHDHTGAEYTLVVTGAFRDSSGRYGPGDLSVRQPGEIHRPTAEPGEVCFALAVSEGDVAFTGTLGLLQRFFTRH